MESLKIKFLKDSPDGFYLKEEISSLEPYLLSKGFLSKGDAIGKVEKAGNGNMNAVIRVVQENGNSFIVKQARPWVEKYPSIPAPISRIHVENHYYQLVRSDLLISGLSPKILGFDPYNSLLVIEDLKNSVDYSFIYQIDRSFEQDDLQSALAYLNQLKRIPKPSNYPDNLELRKLNHQHIFHLPFANNLFELNNVQPGLQTLANRCKNDHELIRKVAELGKSYLGNGQFLLHGDFYPGSLLRAPEGLKVIDPEFSFFGPEEWDIAVFMAHLFLAKTPIQIISESFSSFTSSADFNLQKFSGFLGTEIIRRLLGLAQVPVDLTLNKKSRLIDQAINWIKTGKIDTLSGYENNYLSR